MKKRISLILVFVLIVTLLGGCDSKDDEMPVPDTTNTESNDEVKSDELKLSKNDLEKIQEQGVIYTELNIGGSRNRYFVQLDRETNCLLYEKADRIGQNIPEDIFGVKIDRELRDQIREGKQVTVKSGNKEYTIVNCGAGEDS